MLGVLALVTTSFAGDEHSRPVRSRGGAGGRVELHVHLDGTADAALLLELAQLRNLSLPGVGVPRTTRDIDKVVKSESAFARFDVVNNIMGGDAAVLRHVGVWFAARQASLNASYTEVRYDPRRAAVSSYANSSLPMSEAIAALSDGLRAGADAHGVEVYSLLCAMRDQPVAACDELAEAAAAAQRPWRDAGEPPPLGAVVGIDLAGDEWHHNNSAGFIRCFRRAKEQLRLNTTAHVGEAGQGSAADVATAVLEMRADRLGHGYAAAQNETLLALLASTRTHLEACPGTALAEGSLAAVGIFRQRGLSFGLNEDDPSAYFGGCGFGCIEAITQDCTGNWTGALEARLLCDAKVGQRLHFGPADVAKAYANARQAAFVPVRD